jgi:hypothetical protein
MARIDRVSVVSQSSSPKEQRSQLELYSLLPVLYADCACLYAVEHKTPRTTHHNVQSHHPTTTSTYTATYYSSTAQPFSVRSAVHCQNFMKGAPLPYEPNTNHIVCFPFTGKCPNSCLLAPEMQTYSTTVRHRKNHRNCPPRRQCCCGWLIVAFKVDTCPKGDIREKVRCFRDSICGVSHESRSEDPQPERGCWVNFSHARRTCHIYLRPRFSLRRDPPGIFST